MASYQQDFGADFSAKKIRSLINSWEGSSERMAMADGVDYFNGNNVTIRNVTRMFWSDKSKTMKVNPYVAQNRIGFDKFHDVVSQKVSTLLNEPPIIDGFDDDEFTKRLGFALKKTATYSSCCGVGWMFYSEDNQISVFNPVNCIAFRDDEDTSVIRAFIRYWKIGTMTNSDSVEYAEVYTEDGMTKYRSGKAGSDFIQIAPIVPYREMVMSDFEGIRAEVVPTSKIPLVELDNNDGRTGDLTPTLRAKIDIIDIVNSGFANNIQDFSDVYWVIKASSNCDTDVFEEFMSDVSRTHKIVAGGDGSDVEPHQFEIPVQARSTFCDRMKTEIADETGVVDPKDLTGSSVTNVAIKAVTMKLRQRVSDFEWDVYNACQKVMGLYNEYNSTDYTGDISFTWLLVDNQTEIIDNAQKIQPNISQDSYLALLKRADYISNVEEEKRKIAEEQRDKFSLVDMTEADVDNSGADMSTPQEMNNVGHSS
jgi:hypothetical protein